MFKKIILTILINFCITQTYPEFGSSQNLDIVTWNIENFPKHPYTIDYVVEIIEDINVDIIALQEISESNDFLTIVQDIEDWSGYYASWPGLAYLYNTNTIMINDVYEIYATSNYWYYFPRSPYVMEITYNNIEFYIINNHLKCCGGNENEERRRQASILLEVYIEENLYDKNVILLGDLNDDIAESEDDNVFWNFIEDPFLYYFADMNIALGPSSNWSYPTWPSHLDHILVTNELFNYLNNENSSIVTLKLDNYLSGWSEYENFISDHRPVMISLSINNAGDLNNDNQIDILDIISLIELILDNNFDSLGDLNNDNYLNITDIVLLVNLIIG